MKKSGKNAAMLAATAVISCAGGYFSTKLLDPNQNLPDRRERSPYEMSPRSQGAPEWRDQQEGLGYDIFSAGTKMHRKAENKTFQRFIREKIRVLTEISELPETDSTQTEKQSWHWAKVIDSPSETQGNYEYEYGDTCGVEGKVEQMGQLSTGQYVMRLQERATWPVGTECPAGTVFLVSDR